MEYMDTKMYWILIYCQPHSYIIKKYIHISLWRPLRPIFMFLMEFLWKSRCEIVFVRIRYCCAYTIASLFVSVKGKHGAPILLPLSASGLAAFQPYIFHTQNNTKYSVDIKWLKTSLQSLLTIYFADSDLMRAVKIITKMFKILTLTCCFFRLVSSLPLI